jgi:hypothetical protein
MTKSIDKKWNKQYEQLVEFKRKNGNCVVPKRYKEDLVLGMWVSRQRKSHSNNKIRLDRKELLDEIGFVWKVRIGYTDEIWPQQYEKLVEFKRKYGHCIVPQGYEIDTYLGKWVSYQRQMHIKNKMRQDRIELLDELGFAWKVRGTDNYKTKTWDLQYENLVEFKQTNGHCLVPQGYEKDVYLWNWVCTQRRTHANNIMRHDRKVLLDELGFVWKADTLAARASTTDVSCRWWIISRFIQVIFLTLVLFLLLTCVC